MKASSNPLTKAGAAMGARTWFLLALLSLGCSANDPPEAATEGQGGSRVAEAVFADSCCSPGDLLACQDGRWCTGVEGCDCWGNCEVGVPINCNDGDPCTNDSCVDDRIDPPGTGYGEGHCEHICIPGPTCVCPECLVNSDCDDADACTVDVCDAFGQCVYMDLDCNDHDICTDDSCDALLGCVHTPVPGCCNTSADCNDGIICTTDICSLATHECQNQLVAGYCLIGGVCYTNGTVNPANACESCQYLLQTDRWSGLPAGTACDDGRFCTTDSVCDGDGNCVGAGNPCNDGEACTDDVCNEATDSCEYPVRDTYCLIGGVCWVDYDINPANECQRCLSTTSKTAWSGVPATTACDDGLFCTAVDACDGLGSCVGAGNPCDDGIGCTDNTCNEASGSCSNPVSVNQCYIAAVCYTHHDWNPANDCQWCDSTLLVNRTVWTNRPAGSACPNGLFCDGNETCDGAGVCVDNVDPCIDAYACTVDTCDEGTDTCSYPIDVGWCLITNVCYANNDDNPANECKHCQSAVVNTAWTNKPGGSSCDDGLFCTGVDECDGLGWCVSTGNPCDDGLACTTNQCNEATTNCSYPPVAGTCVIGGACYNQHDWNPLNNCQWCETATSQTAWTNLPSGTDCDDGDFCNGTATCDGSGTCVFVATDCDDGFDCTTDGCDEVADTCTNTIDAGTCLILGACYVDTELNPANDCQECDSLMSQTSWTNMPSGTACDDGTFCTAVDECNGLGACMGTGDPCDDGIACTDDNCNEITHCSNPVSSGQCYIGIDCYAEWDLNPANDCQWCDTSSTQIDWTNRPEFANCDDGDFCNGTETCDSAGNCLDRADPCVDGIACTDDDCDEGTNTCDYPISTDWCYISSTCVADGTDRPGNVCQWCDDSASQVAWTNKPDGQYIGCDSTVDECNYNGCVSGSCQVVADAGAACDYSAVNECRDPGICQADGTCGQGPWVYPPNDQCGGSIGIPLTNGDGSVSGTTICAQNDYSGSCGGGSAPEVVYNFDLTVGADFQLYATNVVIQAPYDCLLYLRSGCTDSGSWRCNDDCTGNAILDCAAYGLDAQDSGTRIRPEPMGTSRNISVFVDGWDAASMGDYTLIVDRVNNANNPCSTSDDDSRLPIATDGGVYRGNITGYVNDLVCSSTGEYRSSNCDCISGSVCSTGSSGTSTFPARAWFRLQPSVNTTYCIYTDESVSANAFDSVVEVFERPTGCGGDRSYITCDYGAGALPAAVQFTAWAGTMYHVGVSAYCDTTPGTEYEVHIVPNPSSCP